MGLREYLVEYVRWEDKIVLVYHPEMDSFWNDRCLFGGGNYSSYKPYNHRSMLQCEVVIEFDRDSLKENRKLAERVSTRLGKDDISHSVWHSGNKSYHIHVFFDLSKVSNERFAKKVLMKHYTYGIGRPDMALASSNHLIRAEYGVHEKSGQKKSKKRESEDYPVKNEIPSKILEKIEEWEEPEKELDYNYDGFIQHKGIQYFKDTEKFKKCRDGKKRALFHMIHALKPHFDKKELVGYLYDWWREVRGYGKTRNDIQTEVEYQWDKSYVLWYKLNDLLREIGKDEYVDRRSLDEIKK